MTWPNALGKKHRDEGAGNAQAIEERLTARQINPPDTSLLVTEPYFNLPNIAETYDQMIFEEWEFASYYRCTRTSPSATIPPYMLCCHRAGIDETPKADDHSRGSDTLWRHV